MTIEERLAVLEIEVASLKKQLAQGTNGDWLEKVSGSMSDIPKDVWNEFQKCCSEIRKETPSNRSD